MGRTPVQASGDHQLQHEPEVTFKPNCDSLPNPLNSLHHTAFGTRQGRVHGPQEKWAGEADLFERLPNDAHLKRINVSRYIGQFGHSYQLAWLRRIWQCRGSAPVVSKILRILALTRGFDWE